MWPHIGALRPGFVQRAHEAGLQLGTWGIASPPDVRRANEYSVDAVTLDWPDWASSIAPSPGWPATGTHLSLPAS